MPVGLSCRVSCLAAGDATEDMDIMAVATQKTKRKTEKKSSDEQTEPKRAYGRIELYLLKPAQINGEIYKAIDPKSERIQTLAANIRRNGLLQPIHITTDLVILSGHTRAVACKVAGLKHVDVCIEPFESTVANFNDLLVSHNSQRKKTPDEEVCEALVQISPEDAHTALLKNRADIIKEQNENFSDLRIIGQDAVAKRRKNISMAKRPMLDKALEIFQKYKEYWPLSLRTIHYRMSNANVLRHSKKPDSTYENNQLCYDDLGELLVRARVFGLLPWDAMEDQTRPHSNWFLQTDFGAYVAKKIDKMFADFWWDLKHTQDSFIEIVCEKLTVQKIALKAGDPYCIQAVVGRGYGSVSCLHETAKRFKASGKNHFKMLILTDLDPEGENIAQVWARDLWNEHGIRRDQLQVFKVGVNPEHIARYNLKPVTLKETSSRYDSFVAEHGENAYELEAFEPFELQQVIEEAILTIVDRGKIQKEQGVERHLARALEALRQEFQTTYKRVNLKSLLKEKTV